MNFNTIYEIPYIQGTKNQKTAKIKIKLPGVFLCMYLVGMYLSSFSKSDCLFEYSTRRDVCTGKGQLCSLRFAGAFPLRKQKVKNMELFRCVPSAIEKVI